MYSYLYKRIRTIKEELFITWKVTNLRVFSKSVRTRDLDDQITATTVKVFYEHGKKE